MTTEAQYKSKVKRQLIAQGFSPLKAIYDAGGNCTTCGEAGRCPGWHTEPPRDETMTIELNGNQVVQTDWKPSPEASEPVVVNLGTAWVAPGEGSTWAELIEAFDSFGGNKLDENPLALYIGFRYDRLVVRTNLLLTGAPLQPYDRQRWESGQVK